MGERTATPPLLRRQIPLPATAVRRGQVYLEGELAGPTLHHQTPDTQHWKMTSKFSPPTQLKKGNKEPNPMVQLSVQDVTQESKVGGEHSAGSG